MGIAGYTMQIYCDFSGYSDMAIGIASILGFKLSDNFRLPYQSKNITEFWRRWHISLSSWLRDYIYIPLGGNRRGKWRTYANNLATMLIGGLWHGAAWKFVFWGGMHGVGLMLHKALKPQLSRIADTRLTTAASRVITITFVSLLRVFFRAETFTDATTIIVNAFSDLNVSHIVPFIAERGTWCAMMAIIITAHSLPLEWLEKASQWFVRTSWIVKLLIFMLTALLFNTGWYITNAMGIYFFDNVMGNKSLLSYFAAIGGVGQALGLFLLPVLSKKFTRRKVIQGAMCMTVIGYLGMFLFGPVLLASNAKMFIPFAVFALIGCMGIGCIFVSQTVMLADIVDYGEYSLGYRSESIVFSMKGFLQKLAYTIQSIVIALGLQFSHYDATLPVQTELTKNTISTMMFIIPPIFVVLSLIIFTKKYKLHGELSDKVNEFIMNRKAKSEEE